MAGVEAGVVAGAGRNVTSAAVWAVVSWRVWVGQWPCSRLWIISSGLPR